MAARRWTGTAGMVAVFLTVLGLSCGKPTAAQEGVAAVPEANKELSVDLGGGVKMEFVLIRPGSFMMGSEKGADDEKPVHNVTITKLFYLGKYEVMQEQWEAVMGANPSSFKGPKNPVENVGWEDCQTFLRKLSERVPGGVFRPPTEAEWEYACRAGTTTEFCYGDDQGGLGEYAWYDGNSEHTTHPVGQKKANAWGLFDMHGNVWEWCSDWFGKYDGNPATDPTGAASGQYRVGRGGSWLYGPEYCRSANRGYNTTKDRIYTNGLRAARTLE